MSKYVVEVSGGDFHDYHQEFNSMDEIIAFRDTEPKMDYWKFSRLIIAKKEDCTFFGEGVQIQTIYKAFVHTEDEGWRVVANNSPLLW